ncbi:MAG: amidohydrolase family protein, partial [bacterium]
MMRNVKLCVGIAAAALIVAGFIGVLPGVESRGMAQSAQAPFELVIADGQVLDGTGNPSFYADVGIRDGKVAAVGNLKGEPALRTLDATGLYVCPGFIDVHTHVDEGIFENPLAENFVYDGVTTVISGNCGGSVMDVGKYLDAITTGGAGLNMATLFGHGTARRAVMGSEKRDPMPEELERMQELVAKAMDGGAVGVSTGLIYIPGTFSKTSELIEVTRPAAAVGGIYASHMRDEGEEILAAIDEALTIGREAGCRVEISHYKLPGNNLIGGAKTILAKVEQARAAGQEVWVDQYPYTASSTGLNVLLPDDALDGGTDAAKQRIKDPEQRAKIREQMYDHLVNKRRRADLSYAVVANYRADKSLNGKNILEITKARLAGKKEPDKIDMYDQI